MSEPQSRLIYLYKRFIRDEITAEELFEFWQRIKEEHTDETFIQTMMKHYEGDLPPEIEIKNWQNAEERIFEIKPSGILAHIRRTIWKAASIIILIGGLAAYLFLHENKKVTDTHIIPVVTQSEADVIAPEKTHATITLANGTQILLDSAESGELAMQNHVAIIKSRDGSIRYGAQDTIAEESSAMNTLSNPRGSRVVSMMLSDGSRVWLNAESSITYPVWFAGSERKVEVKGEAYFEIAHHAHKKFIVVSGDLQTVVYGTHFNVNAFEDEGKIRVTLLEGSVKVAAAGGKSLMLKPGEQAEEARGDLSLNRNIDTEDVIAWKNERFSFRVANIQTIMKEVGRWYNVEIQYNGEMNDLNFGGSMSRQSNVSELLRRLEATQTVKFDVVGRVITVTRK